MKLNPENIRAARLAAGLSPEDAAYLARASRATIFNTEAGRTIPRSDLLGRMAAVYRVGVQDFFDPQPEPIGAGVATNREND